MRTKAIAVAAIGLLALAPQTVCAQSVIGANIVEVPANSDVLVSVPYTQDSEGTFAVTGVTGTGVQVAGPLDAFDADMYYVRFIDGDAEGRWSTITSNTSTELGFEDTSFLGDISVGDEFRVFPHQTLGTVFPDSLKDGEGSIAGAFKASPNAIARATEVLVLNADSTGLNKSAAATYFYYNDAWRKVGDPLNESFDDVVLPPQQYFIIRNNDAETLNFVTLGSVPLVSDRQMTLVESLPTASQDNDVIAATGRPLPTTLADLNLGGTSAFQTTTQAFQRKDELLVFDNTQPGLNKSAAGTYFYMNDAWRKVGDDVEESFDDEVLPAGAAMIIRKAATSPGTVDWIQPAP